jgi:peptidoglycan/xylan/chitin deacetylase (PgdA/CDA1 family)
MLVLRHFPSIGCAIGCAAIALLISPPGGGSDLSRASKRSADSPDPSPRPIDAPAWPALGREHDAARLAAAARPGRSPGHGPKTGFQPAASPRELLLSFDDGPDLKGTPLILDELDRRGLKGIFFVTGWRLAGDHPEDVARRDLVRKIASHGHLVANHTMTHKNLCQNPAEQAVEIDGASEIVTQATGVRPLLFRAPYGAYCRSLAVTLAARELPDIGWNLDPQDWKNTDPKAMLKYLISKLSRLEGRGILLLHDTHAASVTMLPLLLDWIARENHRAVSAGQAPITLADYSVLIPEHDLAKNGLETIVSQLAAEVGASVGRLLGP